MYIYETGEIISHGIGGSSKGLNSFIFRPEDMKKGDKIALYNESENDTNYVRLKDFYIKEITKY